MTFPLFKSTLKAQSNLLRGKKFFVVKKFWKLFLVTRGMGGFPLPAQSSVILGWWLSLPDV
jgi:hypothetical protein